MKKIKLSPAQRAMKIKLGSTVNSWGGIDSKPRQKAYAKIVKRQKRDETVKKRKALIATGRNPVKYTTEHGSFSVKNKTGKQKDSPGSSSFTPKVKKERLKNNKGRNLVVHQSTVDGVKKLYPNSNIQTRDSLAKRLRTKRKSLRENTKGLEGL